MLSFELRETNGTTAESYQSETVSSLLTNHGIDLAPYLPAPEAGAVPNWPADELIARLEAVTQQIIAQVQQDQMGAEMVEQDVALSQLNEAQLAVIRTEGAIHYTRDDIARVRFRARVIREYPIQPAIADINQLIDSLKRGRANGWFLITHSLV